MSNPKDVTEIYDQIPKMHCKPGCGDCCGVVPWAPVEWAKVELRAPAGTTLTEWNGHIIPSRPDSAKCPFFNYGCTVYADRPFMCRLFGTAPDARLTCPHGCAPSVQMTNREADGLTKRFIRTVKRMEK